MSGREHGVAAPGWYADPGGSGRYRYWDGGAWTNHLYPPVDLDAKTSTRRSVGARIALAGGAAAMLLSLFMPWATAGIFSVNGVETEDGKIFLAFALAAVLLAVLELAAPFDGGRGRVVAGVIVALLGVVLSGYEIGNVASLADDGGLFTVNVGSGLYLGLGGSVAFGLGAIGLR